MPRRGHGQGEQPARPRRPRGGDVASARHAEDAIAETARAGRIGAGARPDHLITQGTNPPGGVPAGHPTRIDPAADAEVKRSLERENSAAVALAASGYRIQQNPTPAEVARARLVTGDDGKARTNPDYLLEGRVFDCYAPAGQTSVRGVATGVKKKVRDGQAQRVVLDLTDWRGDFAALQKQFDDWPIAGLKEAKAVLSDGTIAQVRLPQTTD